MKMICSCECGDKGRPNVKVQNRVKMDCSFKQVLSCQMFRYRPRDIEGVQNMVLETNGEDKLDRECNQLRRLKKGWSREKFCRNNKEQKGEDVWIFVA